MKGKRKTRLDKGTSSEFIGFNAFAAPVAAAASTTGTTAQTTTVSVSGNSSHPTWSPIYTGSDSTVQTAFSWLTSKRDSVTHVKALQSLLAYMSREDVPKKLQALAVPHWIWLYHRKLYFDSTAAVRAAALQLWVQIRLRLPKVFANLVQTEAATTASIDATVVLGMLFSTQIDAATEVQAVASDPTTRHVLFAELHGAKDETTQGTIHDNIDWKNGILAFCEYILSCGRHSVFYEKLLQGKKSTQTSSYSDLGDEQKDNVLETHTRVTASALDTLVYYIRHHHCQQPLREETSVDTTVWYKTLSSSHDNLRQRTYALVAAVALHCPTTLNVPNLTQSLSSEKQPANWPALLEALLAVTQASDSKTLAPGYVNPVVKAWKKALYGANMRTAGPMLLPLSACLATPMDVWKLLHAAWEGRELTLGGTDRWRKVQAIAECLVFGLLRKQEPTTTNDVLSQYHMKWPQLFGEILLEALGTDPAQLTGMTLVAYEDLLKSLGQDLIRLEAVIVRQTDKATNPPSNGLEFVMGQDSIHNMIAAIIPFQDKETNEVVALSSEAVSTMLKRSETLLSPNASPFVPVFRKVFESLCPKNASGDVPSLQNYGAMEILMDRMSCQRLFDTDGFFTIEKFIMNDLLRWSIIHTSTLATGHSQNEAFVAADFRLLYRCLDSLGTVKKKVNLWEPFLREVVSAKCEVTWLTVALRILLGDNATANAAWIRCNVLDNFFRDVDRQIEGNEEESTSENSGQESFDEQFTMKFFGLCCGVSSTISNPPLVDPKVVKALAEEIFSADHVFGSRPSPIERTLLRIVKANRPDILDESGENKFLLHAWSQGSHRLVNDLLACLKDRNELVGQFIADAATSLQKELKDFGNMTGHEYQKKVKIWAAKAADLFTVCSETAPSEGTIAPSLSLIGLSDREFWASFSNVAFDLSMAVFAHQTTASHRFRLLSNCTDIGTTDLLVSILLALSDATTDLVQAEAVSSVSDRCARFLGFLGGPSLDGGFLELCVRDTVRSLVGLCKGKTTKLELVRRHVAVISQLTGVLFRPLNAPKSVSVLSAESIKAGDQLWYITDPTKPDERVPAKVVKAHFDSEAGHYFSVSIKKGTETQERQTVVSRLRTTLSDVSTTNGVNPKDISDVEKSQRGGICDLLLQSIVFPFFYSFSWKSCIAELVNVVVSQVGIGDSRGLGSCHFDLFQLLKKVTTTMIAALTEKHARDFEESAWKLSLACGFGLSVPPCDWVARVFSLDLSSILGGLSTNFLLAHDESVVAPTLSLCCTLSGAIDISSESFSAEHYLPFVFGLVKQTFETNRSNDFTSDTFLALKVLNQTALIVKDPNAVQDNIAEICSLLLRSFVSSWKDSKADTKIPAWVPHLERTFNFFLKDAKLKSVMGTAAAALAEELTSCMFSRCKQYLAFRLLESVSDRKVPLRDESSISLAASTESRAEQWTAGLSEDERSEIMQDIEIVSQWLPMSMMTEIEKWQDETFENIDEGESVGRFLVWLTTLNMIHAAAPLDFRNRPAFVSFLKLTSSSNSILNRAILFEPNVNDPKTLKSTPAAFSHASIRKPSDAQVENLSSLVLFRTAEVLPSLCRRWWEEECPKVYIGAVQTMVEKHIAPAILTRELSRVRRSSELFGDMNVSGSPATRQVTAMYVQDDFTLKVLIQLPSTFPLRSAEVDCSKTLGVPQTRWKRWTLQITQMLNNQGGTLQDALLLWKDNVDREFEGIEPCPVCYSVLHVKTHKLPSLECTVCHNRFHSDCLQQWFRSSGKSQCVLCQQDWRGTRV